MVEQRNTDKLAGIIIKVASAAVIIALCWYFKSTILYIILAAVVSLLSKPIAHGLSKLSIKGHRIPPGVIAIVSLLIVMAVLSTIVTQVFPVVGGIIHTVSLNMSDLSFNSDVIAGWFNKVNHWLIVNIPWLGYDFKMESTFGEWLGKNLNATNVTSVVGSVASALGSIGVGFVSIFFIGFFFVRDETLFSRIVGSMVPDRIEEEVKVAIKEIEYLLTRYFVGLLTEILGVAFICFFGLLLIPKIGLSASIGIAFIAGLLNIIPYIGPWIGAGIGTILGVFLKMTAEGPVPDVWVVISLILSVFLFAQIVDNFVFQPLIYSKSIKSSPLEIFIVILIAGHIGGILGMLVAIPTYTIIRVIASRFLRDFKPVRRLIESTEEQSTN